VELCHTGAETQHIERVDSESSVAALGTTETTREPGSRFLRRVGESRVHDLNEFGIAGGQAHVAKDSRSQQFNVGGRQHRFPQSFAACYKRHEAFVIYLEHTPAAPLNRFIRMFWYTRAEQVGHRRERILPTGSTQVIVNLAREYLCDCPEGAPDSRMPPSLIVGARSIYEIVDTSDMADLIGIVFQPCGLPAFAGDAADRFSNRSVALEDVWGLAARGLRERLVEMKTPQARLGCLESFLTERLATRLVRNASPHHAAVDFALGRFRQGPGISTVREVARSTGWSERRFSQVFREQVGLSPKVWCRIQRFQRAVRLLHAGVEVPWPELALDCGFYDQSHFANEFRAFSGVDATTYSVRRTLWANHIPVE
jgi:AraC-like DNA-binding protein